MVPIQVSGHEVEITPTLHDFINKKFDRVGKHSHHITTIHIFLSISKLVQKAEATLHIPGHQIFANAESEDMYKTIDLLVAKVIRQLDKYKEKLKNH
jgi:putative sigma-54 modulation protein